MGCCVSAKSLVEGEKSNNEVICKYLKLVKCSIYQGLFWLVGGLVSDFATPLFIGWCVELMIQECYGEVDVLAGILFGLIVFTAIASGLRARIFNTLSDKIYNLMRVDIFQHVIFQDTAFYDKKDNSTGQIISRMSSDTEVIQDLLSTNISMVVRGVIFILAVLIMMFILNVNLTLITIAATIPISIMTLTYGRNIKVRTKMLLKEKGAMTMVCQEAFTNIRTVKAFACEDEELAKFTKVSVRMYAEGMKKQCYMAWFVLSQQLFNYGAMMAVVYAAYQQYLDKENTGVGVGTIATFLMYQQSLVFNFWMLSFVVGNVMGIGGGVEKITALLNSKITINTQLGDTIENEKVQGILELKDVVFRYPEKKDVVALKGISFTVNNTDKRVIALVGTSGCGKSSSVAMMQRFYDPESGQVLFNGRDLRELDQKWYHQQVAIVQQEPILFNGTIMENICYGLDDQFEKLADAEVQEKVEEACQNANAYEFIMDKQLFPDGFKTQLGGKDGVKLSGGQKQRVAIARALIREPKLLILDEATSALDTMSEKQVQESLDKLIQSGKQSVVIIAHRLSTIKDADEIIVLNKGSIMERGTHDQLVAADGPYKKLVQRQLVKEKLSQELKEDETNDPFFRRKSMIEKANTLDVELQKFIVKKNQTEKVVSKANQIGQQVTTNLDKKNAMQADTSNEKL